MTIHHSDYVRTIPGGAGVAGASVTFRRHVDATTITAAVTSDANGKFTKDLSATATTGANSYELLPGPYYTTFTSSGVTRIHSSGSIGSAGAINIPAQVIANKAMGNGVIVSPPLSLATFAVTAGAGLTAVVATGVAMIEGIPVVMDVGRTINIANADATNPRIDRVVLEVIPMGQAEEGKATLKRITGTPAASPVAPALTQTSATYQISLAQLRVNAAATTVSTVTDERNYVLTGSITRNPTLHDRSELNTQTPFTGNQGVPLATKVGPILLTNVVYDCTVRAVAEMVSPSTSTTALIAPYLDYGGPYEGAYSGHAYITYRAIFASYMRTFTGTGAAISFGVYAKRSGAGTCTMDTLAVELIAIPRT